MTTSGNARMRWTRRLGVFCVAFSPAALALPVATIGIRGTDFSVVMCQRDCRDSDGTTAAKGLYGEVIQGRIAVTPFEDRLLEREFGAGEFFHLADERSSPAPLFLPPPFLRKEDEQARFMGQTAPVL